WMRDNRYLESPLRLSVAEVVQAKLKLGQPRQLVTVAPSDSVSEALERMQSYDFSQLPVFEGGAPVGAIYEDAILSLAIEGRDLKKQVVREVMGQPFPVLRSSATVDQVTACITRDCPAVFVEMSNSHYEILTKYDLLQAIAHLVEQPQ
ncbi:MAG: hypothetical protein DMG24_06615, partial [Acidobacteria bacterium]